MVVEVSNVTDEWAYKWEYKSKYKAWVGGI